MEALKRCFIIANGPSQNNVDLSLLKDETTFGMNDIRLRFPHFYPTYWVIVDGGYWESRHEAIYADNHPCTIVSHKHAPPDDPRGFLIKFDGGDDSVRCGDIRFLTEPNTVWFTGLVSYTCMQVAWQLGYRELNLIGFDSLNTTMKGEGHFDDRYGTDYPFKRPKPPDWVEKKIQTLGIPPDHTERVYKYAIKFIHDNGGQIWDVSDGKTNIFPKRSIDEALLYNR